MYMFRWYFPSCDLRSKHRTAYVASCFSKLQFSEYRYWYWLFISKKLDRSGRTMTLFYLLACLKEDRVLRENMRIICTWCYGQNPLTIPFRKFQLHLGPLIPYSAILKILVRSLIFHIFTRVENLPLNQRLKHKRRMI